MLSRPTALMAFSLALLLVLPGMAQAQSQDPNPQAPQWTEADYRLTVTGSFQEVLLDGSVAIHEVDPPPDFESVCPTPCTADDIRALYQDPRFPKDQVLSAIEDAVAQQAKAALAAVAGPGGESSATATASRESLEQEPSGDGFQPAIPVSVTGSATIAAFDTGQFTPDQVDALFKMGARIDLALDQAVEPGDNLTMELAIPAPLAYIEAQGADLETSGGNATATWTVENWQGDETITLQPPVTIGRDDVQVPTEEDLDLNVILDISDIDLHYANLLGEGDPASADISLAIEADVGAIATPAEIPDPIRLPYLSADAIRVGLDAGLVDRNAIVSFESEARQGIKQAFASSFGVQDAQVTGGLVNRTLTADAIGTPIGSGGPVRMAMSADETISLPPDGGTSGAQAFTITTVPLGELSLPELPLPGGAETTYTILLPDGLELMFENVQGGTVQETTTEDGRTAIVLTSASGQQPTLQGAEIAINHPIVLDLLWPVLLLLFLLLVVLPALIILFVIRRRRDKQKGGRADWRQDGGDPASQEQGAVAGSKASERSSGGDSGGSGRP